MKLSPTTQYVLEAFIPYTKANLQLAYTPAIFFYELEKKCRTKQPTLKSAYYRALANGLLEIDDQGIPRLTAKGQHEVKPYTPKLLGKGSCLLVVFDIEESERFKRTHLRTLLRELSFKKVQRSVWMTH